MGSGQIIRTSCLSLCNGCRERVPVQRLRISRFVPPSILAIAYPSFQQAGTEDSSRVVPPRSVLSVHWTFANSPRLGWELFPKEQTEQETCDTADILDGSNVNLSEVR